VSRRYYRDLRFSCFDAGHAVFRHTPRRLFSMIELFMPRRRRHFAFRYCASAAASLFFFAFISSLFSDYAILILRLRCRVFAIAPIFADDCFRRYFRQRCFTLSLMPFSAFFAIYFSDDLFRHFFDMPFLLSPPC